MKITKQMVRSYHEQANAALKNQIEYDYPKLFKEDLWNKWLVDDRYPLWLGFYTKQTNTVIGISTLGGWTEYVINANPNDNKNNKPATEEQILERLTKEANKKGYKEGNHECLIGSTYSSYNNGFKYLIKKNQLFLNGNCIFNKGVWAEIIEKPVYEWQWLVSYCGGKYKLSHNHYHDLDSASQSTTGILIKRIEETKRLKK